MIRPALLLVSLGAAPAIAEPCREGAPKRGCEPIRRVEPARRFEPYDPDRAKAGRNPGFIDLGNGTEVRIDGRVRLDADFRTRR